jgi:hypothetical protein
MKQIFTFLFLTCFALTSFSQSIIYEQHFDNSITALPTNWTTTGTDWIADTSNASTGYTGASGGTNIVIKNLSATGSYTLTTNDISTIGFQNINVIWGARHTINFPVSGSTIQSFDYSIDGGATWTNAPFIQNASNSIWALTNNDINISLPVSASNAATLRFRWVANIVNSTAGGTYRIDDFLVKGDAANGINNLDVNPSFSFFYNSANGVSIQNNASINLCFTLYNLYGQIVLQQANITSSSSIAIPYANQIYIAVLQSNRKRIVQQILSN